jgi:hypothetical protein
MPLIVTPTNMKILKNIYVAIFVTFERKHEQSK